MASAAAALGVAEVVVVGAAKLSSHGAHGCVGHLKFSHFVKFDDAVAYVHGVRGARICGVEITPTSESVVRHPFGGTTAFLMGNEGHGLTEAQLAACDQTVYIPQHSGATASLNVNAAAAVVLHHFATWASLPEAPRAAPRIVVGAHVRVFTVFHPHSGKTGVVESISVTGDARLRQQGGGELSAPLQQMLTSVRRGMEEQLVEATKKEQERAAAES